MPVGEYFGHSINKNKAWRRAKAREITHGTSILNKPVAFKK